MIFEKKLEKLKSDGKKDFLFWEDDWYKSTLEADADLYGVNQFKQASVCISSEEKHEFSLSDHLDAKEVYLSGSFNDWSTTLLPMQKGEEGWSHSIELKERKYFYKYIVDGRWITDPNNMDQEDRWMGEYKQCILCL